MGRSSRAVSLETRRRIVESARELFGRNGFDGVSLDDVARACEVTRGAVYHHFRDKAALFAEVAAGVHEEIAGHVGAAADAAGGGWDGVVAGCVAFVDATGDDGVRRLLLVDAPAVLGWRAWRRLDADGSQLALEDGLRELEAAGRLAPGTAPAVALVVSGATNEAALALADPEPRPGADRAGVLAALERLVRAFDAGPGPRRPRSAR